MFLFPFANYGIKKLKLVWDLHQKKQVGLDRPWKIAIGSVLIPGPLMTLNCAQLQWTWDQFRMIIK